MTTTTAPETTTALARKYPDPFAPPPRMRLYRCNDPACPGYPRGHRHRDTCTVRVPDPLRLGQVRWFVRSATQAACMAVDAAVQLRDPALLPRGSMSALLETHRHLIEVGCVLSGTAPDVDYLVRLNLADLAIAVGRLRQVAREAEEARNACLCTRIGERRATRDDFDALADGRADFDITADVVQPDGEQPCWRVELGGGGSPVALPRNQWCPACLRRAELHANLRDLRALLARERQRLTVQTAAYLRRPQVSR